MHELKRNPSSFDILSQLSALTKFSPVTIAYPQSQAIIPDQQII